MLRFFFVIVLMLAVQGSFAWQNNKDSVYTAVDKMPEYPGGMPALMKYLMTNLKFLSESSTENMCPKAVASFIIDTEGKTRNVTIVKSAGPGFDKHLIELIERMPLWMPGTLNGKKVKVQYKLPVLIHLSED